jgi:hypothetical protein
MYWLTILEKSLKINTILPIPTFTTCSPDLGGIMKPLKLSFSIFSSMAPVFGQNLTNSKI